ncbi:NADH-ubiquinone oxidoreductase-F iron-sulfur binding region domain-containing protein [Intrasporangium sp.]|uniref:NADH-ubiquinone oxidoreductase-F iron-sulfur binding region domain-containing protein n=1 Tax=Intrasporangium sp. TaxID=1925024 RepID=UPI003221C40C
MSETLALLLRDAGLTGRGGAGFPTAVKLQAALEHHARLIVNACDGEIGAAKDGWVVEHHLDELVHGARLLSPRRTSTIRYAAHRGSPTAHRLRGAGLSVLEVPARYVSSEESSLISLAQGGLARPMTKRTPFVQGGRDSSGRRISPTVVLNAETVWRVAQLADRGAGWLRSFGTADEPGPRLVSVNGSAARGAVLDTEAGVPLTDLLAVVGGVPDDVEAILVGGLGGSFVPAGAVPSLTWSTADLSRFGAGTGPGVVEVVAPSECPVAFVDRFLTYAAGESAGQCGPCMFGVPALAADWRAFAERPSAALLQSISARAGLLPGRGACRFPDGVGRFAASALTVYREHLEGHVVGYCLEPRGRMADVLPS